MTYNNPLNQDFGRRALIRFALPTIVMMAVISTYSILDAILLSRLVSTDSMAAANIAFPVSSFLMGMGLMFGRGGSALIAKQMGGGKEEEACGIFSFLVMVAFVFGIITALTGIFGSEQISQYLGANDILLNDTSIYLRTLMVFAPFTLLQLMFQSFYITAGHGRLGMILMIISGIVDAVLNIVFMGVLEMGIFGAALSTVIGHSISPIVGMVIFIKRRSGLRFLRPVFDMGALFKSCSNGASELVTNMTGGVTTFLFNAVMMEYFKEAGVSAVSIITYSQFFLSSVYIGFSSGVAAIFSFNLGADNHERINRIFKECIRIIGAMSCFVTMLSFLLSGNIVGFFADNTDTVYSVALQGMRFLAISFLFTGINTFVTIFFSAMSEGRIATTISLFRKLVFLVIGITVFPKILGENSVWMTILSGEILTSVICMFLLWKKMKKIKKSY